MRISLLFLVGFLILAVAQTAYYYGPLPPVVASHFNGAGQANGFQSKAAFFGVYWSVVALTVGIFVPLGLMLRRLPVQMINLPHKDYWLAPERSAESLTYLVRHMEWFAVATLALLIVIIQMVLVVNLNGSAVLPPAPTWLALGGYFVFVFVWMTNLLRHFGKPS